MTDKEMEKLLTVFQCNLSITQQFGFYNRDHAMGQDLLKKAIGNLSEILDKLK